MKLSIRDLLWLTVVVALALGWWINNRQQAKEILELRVRLFMSASS